MKKLSVLAIILAVFLASISPCSAQQYSLGDGNLALKVDYINFTQDAFRDIELENGIYVGLEGYTAIYPNLYLGVEAGWAASENDGDINTDSLGDTDLNIIATNVDVEVAFVPIELNLKYDFVLGPSLSMGFGAGISYSYFEIELEGIDVSGDDWLFGGQVFADVNYNISNDWFVGLNGKYQFTDDLELDNVDTATSADNWRVGAHIGLIF